MTDQYVEAAGQELLDAAVTMTIQTWSKNHAVPLECLAARAATEIVCTCIDGAGDQVEHHLSSVRAGLTAEILRRAHIKLNDPDEVIRAVAEVRPPSGRGTPEALRPIDGRYKTGAAFLIFDVVDLASYDSFPASDSPAWINR